MIKHITSWLFLLGLFCVDVSAQSVNDDYVYLLKNISVTDYGTYEVIDLTIDYDCQHSINACEDVIITYDLPVSIAASVQNVSVGNGETVTSTDYDTADQKISWTMVTPLPRNTPGRVTAQIQVDSGTSTADTDLDGVANVFDEYPDDSDRAFRSTFPAGDVMGFIAFEDSYPGVGDGDFNDFVTAFSYEYIYDATGKVKDVEMQFQVAARGATYDHLFGVMIDAPANGSFYLKRYNKYDVLIKDEVSGFGPGAMDIEVFPSTKEAMLDSDYGLTGGFANTAHHTTDPVFGDYANVKLTFATPVETTNLDSAPFNPYIYVKETEQDIHLPGELRQQNSQNTSEFSNFIDANGYPFAMVLPASWGYPLEKVLIDDVYPDFTAWRESGGALSSDWYTKPPVPGVTSHKFNQTFEPKRRMGVSPELDCEVVGAFEVDGSLSVTGIFAEGENGTGTLTIPVTNVTPGKVAVTVIDNGFTAEKEINMTGYEVSIDISPFTYDGQGAQGIRTVTVLSGQTTDTMTVDVEVLPPQTYDWEIGEWGNCTAACGDSSQFRLLTCLGDYGSIGSDDQCPSPKPATGKSCQSRQTCDGSLETKAATSCQEIKDNGGANGNMNYWIDLDGFGTSQGPAQTYCVFVEDPVCGNNAVEQGEACDDGNTDSGDGCSDICQVEAAGIASVCGDGTVGSGEACDDGNTDSADGCSATCQIETGLENTCGNNSVDTDETCDDGNTDSGDGCSDICQIEPEGVTAICGNGSIEPGEACDDGNNFNNDGCSSVCQIEPGYDPHTADTDGDGLTDQTEIDHGLDPYNGSDAVLDTDGDGLTNLVEITQAQSDINSTDSDGDGLPDSFEHENGFSPNDASDAGEDLDNDGIPTLVEYNYGLNPADVSDGDKDLDADGITNAFEYLQTNTDMGIADTDGGGVDDGFELLVNADPLNGADDYGDIDGDGLSNIDEQLYGTDPILVDTDGDGVNDCTEVLAGSDPVDPNDTSSTAQINCANDTDCDGTTAQTPGSSCQALLDNGFSKGDQAYYLDFDGLGSGEPPILVNCDMTTDGGGWLSVIGPVGNLSLDTTDKVSDIDGLSAKTTAFGFGWGDGSTTDAAETWAINIDFTEVQFDYTKFFGAPAACQGKILIQTDQSEILLDADDAEPAKQLGYAIEDGVTTPSNYVLANRTIAKTFATPQNRLDITLNGVAGHPTCHQGISNLKLR